MTKLIDRIKTEFADGLSYEEAVQLCLGLYCIQVDLPESERVECNKETLAAIFSTLAASGLIYDIRDSDYGYLTTVEHWTEVIMSIFKIGGSVIDVDVRGLLINRLTQACEGH